MAFTFVGRAVTASNAFAAGSSFSLPSGTQEGDLLVISVHTRGNFLVGLPADWTTEYAVNSNNLTAGYEGLSNVTNGYIVRGASTPGQVITGLSGSQLVRITVLAYRPSVGTPVFIGQSTLTETSYPTTHNHPSITGLEAGDLLVTGAASGAPYYIGAASAVTDPSTASSAASGSGHGAVTTTGMPADGAWLNRYADLFSGGTTFATFVADGVKASAGDTGTLRFITSNIGNFRGSTMVFRDVASGDITPPIITGPTGAAGASSIAVNVAENTTACGTWAADESVTWSISGTDAALFSINASTGALAFLSAPDFEAPADAGGNNTYDLVVRATDGASNFSEQTVAINVTDVAEGGGDTTPPSAPGTPAFSAVTKNSATVTYTAATDDTAVTGYERRFNGGSVVDLGNVLTFDMTGQTPGATVTVEVRAYDAAGNRGAWASADVTFLIYGVDFDDPALDLELGNVSGSLVDLGMLASTTVRVTIQDPDTSAVVHEATVSTSAAGVLPRVQHAALDGVPYVVLLQTTEVAPLSRSVASIIIQATAP